jgi:hypothetical protein
MVRESQTFADASGHLDMKAVIDAMVVACPPLSSMLDEDADLIGGLPCLQASWIAKSLVNLVEKGETGQVRAVLEIAEQILVDFDQEGRNFIGACMLEGVPDGGKLVLMPFAGPATIDLMEPSSCG